MGVCLFQQKPSCHSLHSMETQTLSSVSLRDTPIHREKAITTCICIYLFVRSQRTYDFSVFLWPREKGNHINWGSVITVKVVRSHHHNNWKQNCSVFKSPYSLTQDQYNRFLLQSSLKALFFVFSTLDVSCRCGRCQAWRWSIWKQKSPSWSCFSDHFWTPFSL